MLHNNRGDQVPTTRSLTPLNTTSMVPTISSEIYDHMAIQFLQKNSGTRIVNHLREPSRCRFCRLHIALSARRGQVSRVRRSEPINGRISKGPTKPTWGPVIPCISYSHRNQKNDLPLPHIPKTSQAAFRTLPNMRKCPSWAIPQVLEHILPNSKTMPNVRKCAGWANPKFYKRAMVDSKSRPTCANAQVGHCSFKNPHANDSKSPTPQHLPC